MTATATAELPSIEKLSAEQKKALLALLVQDELDRQPIPMPIVVGPAGKEIGQFRPNVLLPAISRPYPFTPEERESLIRIARNPGPTFTAEELRAREASEAVAAR